MGITNKHLQVGRTANRVRRPVDGRPRGHVVGHAVDESIMGRPSGAPEDDVMGRPDRPSRHTVMGGRSRGHRFDVLGRSERRRESEVMGKGEPRFVDSLFTGKRRDGGGR